MRTVILQLFHWMKRGGFRYVTGKNALFEMAPFHFATFTESRCSHDLVHLVLFAPLSPPKE